MVVLCGILSFFSSALLITTAVGLLSAILVAMGIRWAPLFGSLLSSYILYVFLIQESFPVYHLVHPKDALSNTAISFGLFIIILLILACTVVALGAGIAATIQNYRRDVRRTPRWLASSLAAMAGMVAGAILIAALAQPGTAKEISQLFRRELLSRIDQHAHLVHCFRKSFLHKQYANQRP